MKRDIRMDHPTWSKIGTIHWWNMRHDHLTISWCINIVVVDILEAYGLSPSRDWSNKLDIYFSIDWSHKWLPYKGKCNQIWVVSERYVKHNVTPLNDENEPLDFVELMFGNCLLETTLECYPARATPTPSNTQLGLLPFPTDDNETCIVHSIDSSISSSNTSMLNGSHTNKMWALDFDES